MHDCPRDEIRDLLPDLLHDRLAPARRAEVEDHVQYCADCAAELELLRSLQSALTRSTEVDVGRIAAALERTRGLQLSAIRGRAGQARWAVAAALVAVVLGGLGYLNTRGGTESLVRRTAQFAHQTLAEGRRVPLAAAQASDAGPRAQADEGTSLGHAPAANTESELELEFAGGLSDLSDGDLRALISDVDTLMAVPEAEPAPETSVTEEGAS